MSGAETRRRTRADDKRRRVMMTPEGIALPITIAARGSRLIALIIDYMIILFSLFMMLLAVGFIAGGMNNLEGDVEGAGEFLVVLFLVALFLVWNGYFILFEMGPRGATWGKRAMKIRVAARDGGRLTPEAVVARNLLRQIEIFLPLSFLQSAGSEGSGAAYFAGAAWFAVFMLFPFFNRDALRAGDVIAGTWVLDAPRTKLAAALSVGEDGAAHGTRYAFGPEELAVYGEHELKTLEEVLRKGDPAAMEAVQGAICRKIGWDTGTGDERQFLEAFYTALRAKLEGEMRFGKRKLDKFDAS